MYKKIREQIANIGVIIGIIMAVYIGFYAVYFLNHPYIKEVDETIAGYLILDKSSDQYELVDVEVEGEIHNYVYNNGDDIIQGDITIYRNASSGDEEEICELENIYGMISEKHPEYLLLQSDENQEDYRYAYISEDMESAVIAIRNGSSEMLLVFPAESKKEAMEALEKVSSDSSMKEWLLEDNWKF